jgi:hypothetical protein
MSAGMLFGSMLSAGGSILQGQAESTSLEAQADLQIQNAAEAREQGKLNAAKSAVESGHKIGAIGAAAGASGVTSDSGSIQEILRASASNAEMDRLNILHGADIKAIQYENAASLSRFGAKSAVMGSYFSAVGSMTKGTAVGLNMWGSQSTMADTPTEI